MVVPMPSTLPARLSANGGLRVSYETGVVPVDRIHFDPDNPRLPSTVNGHDEAAVLKWMLEDATLLDLVAAIASEGYFPGEPILVAPRPEGPSAKESLEDPRQELVVVEGNRRLAAVRLLRRPQIAPTRKRAIAT